MSQLEQHNRHSQLRLLGSDYLFGSNYVDSEWWDNELPVPASPSMVSSSSFALFSNSQSTLFIASFKLPDSKPSDLSVSATKMCTSTNPFLQLASPANQSSYPLPLPRYPIFRFLVGTSLTRIGMPHWWPGCSLHHWLGWAYTKSISILILIPTNHSQQTRCTSWNNSCPPWISCGALALTPTTGPRFLCSTNLLIKSTHSKNFIYTCGGNCFPG